MERNRRNHIADICRVVLGLTFVFSGLVKTIDPWGTALKITEYLGVYGLGTPGDFRFVMAIFLCAAELTMGLLLTFGVKTRLVSVLALLTMSAFMVLTLLSATLVPVEDCGCFGDAVKLSPWASFAKNVALWGLSLVVWRDARRRMKIFPVTPREWLCTVLFACIAVGLGLYCYLHLPLVDFLPYKKGVNLYQAIYGAEAEGVEAGMIYRDIGDGSLHEFSVSDTTWHDTDRWEFVEMVEGGTPEGELSLREFAIFDPSGDATREITGYPGRVYMLCAVRFDCIRPRCEARFAKIAQLAHSEGARVVLLTATPLAGRRTATFGGSVPVEIYNVDATTMITMLRASTGVVVMEDGVITDKKNCRDI